MEKKTMNGTEIFISFIIGTLAGVIYTYLICRHIAIKNGVWDKLNGDRKW
jgi:cellobiose-specific phosphotransferase system component IIC